MSENARSHQSHQSESDKRHSGYNKGSKNYSSHNDNRHFDRNDHRSRGHNNGGMKSNDFHSSRRHDDDNFRGANQHKSYDRKPYDKDRRRNNNHSEQRSTKPHFDRTEDKPVNKKVTYDRDEYRGRSHFGADHRNDRPRVSHRSDNTNNAQRYERINDLDGSRHFENGPRRNSDGTISFPSQNPYTARRPGEPKMPAGMEWSMLSSDDRMRLRGLSKEHAENIGLHILAAYALEESNPESALAHAKWVARQASRIDITRETLALIAYRQGDYKLANREFRTAYRMNGETDYLPFIADCERGLHHPERAIEIALSDDSKQLTGESKAEMMLVFAGAYADMGKYAQAVKIAHTLSQSRGINGGYRMRALQAEQYFLDQDHRGKEAEALDDTLDKLEALYADVDEADLEDDIIDNDLENIDEEILKGLGIDLTASLDDETTDMAALADEDSEEPAEEDATITDMSQLSDSEK